MDLTLDGSSNFSESSVKLTDADGEFTLTRQQMKQRKRRERRHNLSAVSPPPDTPVAGFSATVPAAFIYRCSKDTQAEIIKDHLTSKGIQVISVDLKSHKDAESRSFKISVGTLEDYDKILSRDFIPRYVRVREFINYKGPKGEKRSWDHRDGKSSFMDDPICSANESTDVVKSVSTSNVITDSANGSTNLRNACSVCGDTIDLGNTCSLCERMGCI